MRFLILKPASIFLGIGAVVIIANAAIDPAHLPAGSGTGHLPAGSGTDHLPAGSGTVHDITRNAFGHPLHGVTNEERRQFFVGNSFFKDVWVQAPSSTEGRDGLGPTFNAVSCSSCHGLDGRGIAYREHPTKGTVTDFSLLFRLSLRGPSGYLEPHPKYGDQLNSFGVKNVPGEGKVLVEFEKVAGIYPDGTPYELRRPHFRFVDMAFGDLEPDVRISPRVAPQMIGLGLVEAIAVSDLEVLADPNDLNQDGISGRANYVLNKRTGQTQIGRFGWKAGQPSLEQQNAGAFNGDLGITTRLFPDQNCPSIQVSCRQAPQGGSPEANEHQLLRLTTYTQLLSVPARRATDDPEVLRGQKLFHQVNCQACHTPRFTTAPTAAFAVLQSQIIFPYADFLLHDLGMGLADHRPEALASGREWRTQPLWGVGLIPTVNGHQNLLHDGRARGVEEAILWHGGEADAARLAFMNLKNNERQALILFVNSL